MSQQRALFNGQTPHSKSAGCPTIATTNPSWLEFPKAEQSGQKTTLGRVNVESPAEDATCLPALCSVEAAWSAGMHTGVTSAMPEPGHLFPEAWDLVGRTTVDNDQFSSEANRSTSFLRKCCQIMIYCLRMQPPWTLDCASTRSLLSYLWHLETTQQCGEQTSYCLSWQRRGSIGAFEGTYSRLEEQQATPGNLCARTDACSSNLHRLEGCHRKHPSLSGRHPTSPACNIIEHPLWNHPGTKTMRPINRQQRPTMTAWIKH